MPIEIRAAELNDSAVLLVLINAHADFEKSVATCSESDLRKALTGDVPSIWLAFEDDKPVGYASMTIDFSTWRCREFGHLDCLYVAESNRGSGVGRRLLNTVCGEAQSRGLDRLEWQTPEWNKDAIRFYDRTSARSLSKRRFVLEIGH